MQKIAFKRFNAESLTRILLCCLREEINCKPYDSEVIAEILYNQLNIIKKEVNDIHKILKI